MGPRRKKNAIRPTRTSTAESSAALRSSALHRFKLRLFWVVVLSHAISAVYLLVFAAFHLVLSTQLYFMRQFTIETNMVLVAVVYILSSLLHVRRIVRVLHCSWRLRALRFEFEPRPSDAKSKELLQLMATDSEHEKWTLATGNRLWKKYFSRGGIFGIFGAYGDLRIWCVECLNLAVHMVQARRWSVIARPVTTFILSVLFAIECLYPAIYHGFRPMCRGLCARGYCSWTSSSTRCSASSSRAGSWRRLRSSTSRART